MAVDTSRKSFNKELVTLELANRNKIQGLIERRMTGSWSISFDRHFSKNLVTQAKITISFVRDKCVHTGSARVLALDEEKSLVIITEPQKFDIRPMRAAPRVEVTLPAAVIIALQPPGPDQGPFDNEVAYVFRSDNRIRNLSVTGALLLCREAIGPEVEDLLVLTYFNLPQRPGEDGKLPDSVAMEEDHGQVYFHATVFRRLEKSPLNDFPHAYGIKFKPMFPQFKNQLVHFVMAAGGY